MPRRQLVTALVATAALLGGAPTAVASSPGNEEIAATMARDRACKSVRAGGFAHRRIRIERGLRCRTVRRLLRKWDGDLPKNQFKWFCWKQKRVHRCTLGNGEAPTFRFRRRRVS